MILENAKAWREQIVALLSSEKLPVADLPASLEDFKIVWKDKHLIAVGGIEIYGNYGLLRSIAVAKEFRNTGIAGKLIKQLEADAVSKGLKAIYLLTETAAEYFDQKGYLKIARVEVPVEVQQSSEFSHVCPVSAIVMVKEI